MEYSTTAQHEARGCVDLSTKRAQTLLDPPEGFAAAVIQDTVKLLTTKPTHVSNVKGPYVQVQKVDATSADILLMGSFRAYFSGQPGNLLPSQTASTFAAGADASAAAAVVPEASCQPSGQHNNSVPMQSHGGPFIEEWTVETKGSCDPPVSASKPFVELADMSQERSNSGQAHSSQQEHDGAGAAAVPQPAAPPPLPLPIWKGRYDYGAGAGQELCILPAQPAQHYHMYHQQQDSEKALAVVSAVAALPPPNPLLLAPRPRGEWELDPAKIVLGKRLAVGGFAEVFIGKYEGTLVAVKRLLVTDQGTTEKFVQEVRMLARLRHPNLLLFMGYTLSPEPCIVTEFMARGSLYSILRQGHNKPADARLQRSVAVAVARGMAYLHSRSPPILHLDLKSPNILVDDRFRIKIADFGLSRVRQHTYVSSGSIGGTPEWMAPEVLRCDHYAEPADVFSYGVVLWELLTGHAPWSELNAMQVVGAVGFAHKSLPSPTEGDPTLVQLCNACRHIDPKQRPTFSEVVEVLERHFSPAMLASITQPLLGEDAFSGHPGAVAAPVAPPQIQAPPEQPPPPPLPDAMETGYGTHAGAQHARAPPRLQQEASAPLSKQGSMQQLPHRPPNVPNGSNSSAQPIMIRQHSHSLDGNLPLPTPVSESPRARRRNRSPHGDDGFSPSPLFTKLHKLQDGSKTPSPRATTDGWDGCMLPRAAANGVSNLARSSLSDPYAVNVGSASTPAAAVTPAPALAPGGYTPFAAAARAASPFAAAAADSFGPPSSALEPSPSGGGSSGQRSAQQPSSAGPQLHEAKHGSLAIAPPPWSNGVTGVQPGAQVQPLAPQQLHMLHKHLGRLVRHRRVASDDVHMQQLCASDVQQTGPPSAAGPAAEAPTSTSGSPAAAPNGATGSARVASALAMLLQQQAQQPQQEPRRMQRGLDRNSAPMPSSSGEYLPSRVLRGLTSSRADSLHPLALLRSEYLQSKGLIDPSLDSMDAQSELSFAVNLQDCISVGSGSLGDRIGSPSLDNLPMLAMEELLAQVPEEGVLEERDDDPVDLPRAQRQEAQQQQHQAAGRIDAYEDGSFELRPFAPPQEPLQEVHMVQPVLPPAEAEGAMEQQQREQGRSFSFVPHPPPQQHAHHSGHAGYAHHPHVHVHMPHLHNHIGAVAAAAAPRHVAQPPSPSAAEQASLVAELPVMGSGGSDGSAQPSAVPAPEQEQQQQRKPLASYKSGRFKVTVEPAAVAGADAAADPALSPSPRAKGSQQDLHQLSAAALGAALQADAAHSRSSSGGSSAISSRGGSGDGELVHSPQGGHGLDGLQRARGGANGAAESPGGASAVVPAPGLRMYRKGRFFVSTHPAGATSLATTTHHAYSSLSLTLPGDHDADYDHGSDMGGTRSPSMASAPGSLHDSGFAQEDIRAAVAAAHREISSCVPTPTAASSPHLQPAVPIPINGTGRTYSRGRFDVKECVVTVPAGLQRRSTSAGSMDIGGVVMPASAPSPSFLMMPPASAGPPPAVASSLVEVPPLPPRPCPPSPFSHQNSMPLLHAAHLPVPRSPSQPQMMDAVRPWLQSRLSEDAEGSRRGEMVVKRIGRFTVREPSNGGVQSGPQPAAAAQPGSQGDGSPSVDPGMPRLASTGSLTTSTSGGVSSDHLRDALLEHSGSEGELQGMNSAGSQLEQRQQPGSAQGTPPAAPDSTCLKFTRVKSKGRFTVIEESNEPLSSSPQQAGDGLLLASAANGTSGLQDFMLLGPVSMPSLMRLQGGSEPGLAPTEYEPQAGGLPAPGRSLQPAALRRQAVAVSEDGSGGVRELQGDLQAEAARMLRQRMRASSTLRWADLEPQQGAAAPAADAPQGGGATVHMSAGQQQQARGFTQCQVEVGGTGAGEVHVEMLLRGRRGSGGSGMVHADSNDAMMVDVAFVGAGAAAGDNSSSGSGSESVEGEEGTGTSSESTPQPGTPPHEPLPPQAERGGSGGAAFEDSSDMDAMCGCDHMEQ